MDILPVAVSLVIFIFALVASTIYLRASLAIVFSAFLIRIVLVFIESSGYTLPGSGVDTEYFDFLGDYFRISSITEIFTYFSFGSTLYGWMLGLLYTLTDEGRVVAQLFNALLAALAVAYLQSTLLLKHSKRAAFLIALIFAFWPSYVLFSSILLRESMIVFAVTFAFCALVRWSTFRQPRHAVLTVGMFVLAAMLHTGMVPLIILSPLLFILASRSHPSSIATRKATSKNTGSVAIMVGLSLLVAVIALQSGVGLQKLSQTEDYSSSSIMEYQQRSARNRTAYSVEASDQSMVGLILTLPLRTIYFFTLPLPWQISEISDAAGMLDALMFVSLITVILRYKRIIGQGGYNYAPIVGFIFIAAFFSLVTSNYGTSFRHRVKLLPMLVMAVPLAVQRRRYPIGDDHLTHFRAHEKRKT